MLDAWIIEEILKREKATEHDVRPVLEIPVANPDDEEPDAEEHDEPERGVAIVDFRI